MISEEFREIRLSANLALNLDMRLYICKFKESLVVIHYEFNVEKAEWDVWMMENGDPKSFRKIHTIKSDNDNSIVSVFGSRKSGQPLVEVTKYKLRTKARSTSETVELITSCSTAIEVVGKLDVLLEDEVLEHIRDSLTPKKAWDTLVTLFSKKNDSKLQLLENELLSVSQRDLTIPQYFHKIKTLCREIGELNPQSKIGEAQMKRIIIQGLKQDYGSFVAAVQGWPFEAATLRERTVVGELDPQSKIVEARMKRIIIQGLKQDYKSFVAAVQGWPTQPSLAEFEILLASQEALAKQLGDMSISSTPKTDAEALYAGNKHKGKTRYKGFSNKSNRSNKSEAQSKRGNESKKEGKYVLFGPEEVYVFKEFQTLSVLILKGHKNESVYVLSAEHAFVEKTKDTQNADLWHHRLGHVGYDKLELTMKRELVTRLPKIKEKSEVLEKFKEFEAEAERETNHKMRCLRSDNGGEYLSVEFDQYLKQHQIRRQLTCSNTPQQNGVCERKNRHLAEVMRSMMHDKNLPGRFWAEAMRTACYLINRTPSQNLQYAS
nr:hypothetical protein [Tanacetum cinerariifolium]